MTDRTALTTGANGGIGLETVLELARRGIRSVGTVRTEAKAAMVAEAAEREALDVETRLLDVNDAPACTAVIDEVQPDFLVNNAGYGVTGAIEDVDDDEARQVLETMVVAPMRLTRLAVRHMRERQRGRIVNVSSVYGRTTTPLTGWYQGSKHALEALSDALRSEVAADGITVVLVEPGGFKTGIWEDAQHDVQRRAESRYSRGYQRVLTNISLMQPIMGDPKRCARVIARACTTRWPRARYLVGPDANAFTLLAHVTPTRVKDEILRRSFDL